MTDLVFGPRLVVLLTFLTLVWGFNWPVMKIGVTEFPPLAFRAFSVVLGLPVLWAVLRVRRVPFAIARRDWPELAKLTVTNMLFWHVTAILSLRALSSGRAAILGYTMPIFSALVGFALYGDRLRPRDIAGVVACAFGVTLLVWHEVSTFAGRPVAAIGMLLAAAVWALGTQQMRRTTVAAPTLAIVFWMTAIAAVVLLALSFAFEHARWALPNAVVAWTIAYNAVLIFGFANPTWLTLARSLPPVASSMSVMLIPVLGVVSGAWWLGETLHWQDGAAIVSVLVAIAFVMWPTRPAAGVSTA